MSGFILLQVLSYLEWGWEFSFSKREQSHGLAKHQKTSSNAVIDKDPSKERRHDHSVFILKPNHLCHLFAIYVQVGLYFVFFAAAAAMAEVRNTTRTTDNLQHGKYIVDTTGSQETSCLPPNLPLASLSVGPSLFCCKARGQMRHSQVQFS